MIVVLLHCTYHLSQYWVRVPYPATLHPHVTPVQYLASLHRLNAAFTPPLRTTLTTLTLTYSIPSGLLLLLLCLTPTPLPPHLRLSLLLIGLALTFALSLPLLRWHLRTSHSATLRRVQGVAEAEGGVHYQERVEWGLMGEEKEGVRYVGGWCGAGERTTALKVRVVVGRGEGEAVNGEVQLAIAV